MEFTHPVIGQKTKYGGLWVGQNLRCLSQMSHSILCTSSCTSSPASVIRQRPGGPEVALTLSPQLLRRAAGVVWQAKPKDRRIEIRNRVDKPAPSAPEVGGLGLGLLLQVDFVGVTRSKTTAEKFTINSGCRQ
eukprot:5065128-Amphidinium_carterae.1